MLETVPPQLNACAKTAQLSQIRPPVRPALQKLPRLTNNRSYQSSRHDSPPGAQVMKKLLPALLHAPRTISSHNY